MSVAYIYTMEQKDSCQRMVYGEWLLCTIFRHCAILLSVSGYDISCLPLALSQKKNQEMPKDVN